ncbi:MAG: TonB-dependent receptor [candidate division KSB1 bacterium]|nr:TonB-dependent receptor [candidate division KSB1 bacterium]
MYAQRSGSIEGRVIDAESGEYLPGANIYLEGTQIGAASDANGYFTIENVPFGDYTLKVTYIGYEEFSSEVELKPSDAKVNIDVPMNFTALELDAFVVEGLRQGQVKALNQQKNAANIKNVVSKEEMEKFPDMNTAEVLQRIPGIAVERSLGEGAFVMLRGTEPRLTNVTVNGQKIATPREQDRFIGLNVVNANQLASIDVTKASTPDMDGSAIGGTVNLVTRSAFDYQEPRLNVNLGSGYQKLGNDPLYRASLNYSTFLNKDKTIGVTVGASWYRNSITAHSNEFDWEDVEDINGNEIAEALTDLKIFNYETNRDHIGLNAGIEFRPSKDHRYFINAMYNKRTDDMDRNQVRYRFDKGDYLNATTISGGRVAFELNSRNEIQDLYAFTAGGQNKFGLLNLDYTLSYSHGEEYTGDNGHIKSEWQIKNIDYALDLSDVDFPGVNITNHEQSYFFNPENWNEDKQQYKDRFASNDNFNSAVNVKYPYYLGAFPAEFKAGGKLTIDQKDRNSRRYNYRWRGDYDLGMFGTTGETIDDLLLDNYTLGPIMDGDKASEFLQNNLDPDNGFRKEPVNDSEDGFGGQYEGSESIYAGYLMTTIHFNELMVLAGVRSELTQTTYDGIELQLDDDGAIVNDKPVSQENDYVNFFPAVHFRYNISPMTNVRLAYTQGIARPNYFDLAPYRWIIPDDNEIVAGNPELEPTESKNMDLMLGHYFQSVGAINVGLFYKSLDKVIYPAATRIEGGNYDGYDEIMQVNGGTADLYGVEIGWMQQLTFLPGFWNGFGVYANYTYTQADVDLTYADRDVLPGQAGDVGNVGLSFERGDLTARLSFNYTSEVLVEVETDKEFDRWNDERLQVDFSGSYEFIPGFEFYIDAVNLTNAVKRVYYHIPSRPEKMRIMASPYALVLK